MRSNLLSHLRSDGFVTIGGYPHEVYASTYGLNICYELQPQADDGLVKRVTLPPCQSLSSRFLLVRQRIDLV